MRIGGLFEGYGGLTMGVQAVLGGTVAWHSEIDPAACKVLAHRYPGVPNLGDITTIDWSTVEPVDVLTGGSPCQDVSSAGKRAGMRAGTRSGLWAAMTDAIDQLRPRIVVWENVRGVLGAEADSAMEPCPGCVGDPDDGPVLRALGRVLGDLCELGYDAQWCGLRAADIGAPHGRYRIFVVAQHAAGVNASQSLERGFGEADADRPRPVLSSVAIDADADRGERSRKRLRQRRGLAAAGSGPETSWGPYGPAIRRWEQVLGRVAPAPTEAGPKGGQRLSPAFVEWMMGLPAGWVTDVPGISRNNQLKMLGNGVVPLQAAAAVSWLLDVSEEAA